MAELVTETDQLLTALRMAIRQIQSGDYEVESTVETMPIPAGVNTKGFTKYTTGIKGIEFSLTPSISVGSMTLQDSQPPTQPPALLVDESKS